MAERYHPAPRPPLADFDLGIPAAVEALSLQFDTLITVQHGTNMLLTEIANSLPADL